MTALENVDLNAFDTSLCTNINYMFFYCTSLQEIDVSMFSVVEVINAGSMFRGDSALTTIYATDGTDWAKEATKCTNSTYMFSDSSKLKGAISYSKSRVTIDYANTATGYFTAK